MFVHVWWRHNNLGIVLELASYWWNSLVALFNQSLDPSLDTTWDYPSTFDSFLFSTVIIIHKKMEAAYGPPQTSSSTGMNKLNASGYNVFCISYRNLVYRFILRPLGHWNPSFARRQLMSDLLVQSSSWVIMLSWPFFPESTEAYKGVKDTRPGVFSFCKHFLVNCGSGTPLLVP